MQKPNMNNKQVKVNFDQDAAKQTRGQQKSSLSHKCRYCGAAIGMNAEFCPKCGKKLVNYCTFCGASMLPSDTICEECGMPADGIACPNCGTLNVRSFCRKCNTPLTKAAMRAIEKAKQDPKVKKAAELMERAEELRSKLEAHRPAPNEGEQRLQELLGGKMEFKGVDSELSQIEEEYEDVVKDINQLFEEMLPPAGSTPQEQYNYYSARKVAIETISHVVMKKKAGWVCNYCGCFHNEPNECCEPWRGGKWVYEIEEKDIVVKEYKYED